MKVEKPERFQMPVTLKNILIGVVTTVAASAIVWWLGFNNNKANEKEKQKEATYKTLETLDRYDRLYAETMEAIDCRKITSGSTYMEEEDGDMMLNQTTNNIATLTDLKNEPDIDIDVKALLQRRITYYNAIKNEITKFMTRIIPLGNSEADQAAAVGFNKKFQDRIEELQQTELQPTIDLFQSIEKKYGKEIPGVRRSLELTETNLAAIWKTGNNASITLQNDGKMVSKVEADLFNGTWTLSKDTIKIRFEDGDDNALIVKQLTAKMLYYKIAGDTIFTSACRN